MEALENLEDVQKILKQKLALKPLKGAGIGSIVFGLLALVGGLATMSDVPITGCWRQSVCFFSCRAYGWS